MQELCQAAPNNSPKQRGFLKLTTSQHPMEKEKTMLTIELVPRSCWFSNVRSEVAPADWDKLRWAAYANAGHMCEVCGGVGARGRLECHEIWDYDDATHVQTLAGLVALCPACHEVKHIGLAQVRGRGMQAEAHLARVNRWTARETSQYVKQQFQVWEQRSRHPWRLDLTWLEGQGMTAATRANPRQL